MIGTSLFITTLPPEMHHILANIPNMVGTSLFMPTLSDDIFGSLSELNQTGNIDTTGQHLQSFLEDLQINPLILPEEQAIAIATERSFFSIPFELHSDAIPTSFALQTDAVIATTHRATTTELTLENQSIQNVDSQLLALPHEIYHGINNITRGSTANNGILLPMTETPITLVIFKYRHFTFFKLISNSSCLINNGEKAAKTSPPCYK